LMTQIRISKDAHVNIMDRRTYELKTPRHVVDDFVKRIKQYETGTQTTVPESEQVRVLQNKLEQEVKNTRARALEVRELTEKVGELEVANVEISEAECMRSDCKDARDIYKVQMESTNSHVRNVGMLAEMVARFETERDGKEVTTQEVMRALYDRRDAEDEAALEGE